MIKESYEVCRKHRRVRKQGEKTDWYTPEFFPFALSGVVIFKTEGIKLFIIKAKCDLCQQSDN